MGIFFESRQASPRRQVQRAVEQAYLREPPGTDAEAETIASGLASNIALNTLDVGYGSRARAVLKDALLTVPPTRSHARKLAAQKAAEVTGANDGDDEGGLVPKWYAFIAAAALFLILVLITFWVGVVADGEAATVTNSQVRDLSAKLIGFDVTLAGIVFGLIGGEAVGSKSTT